MINAATSGITGLILAIVPGFVANLFATSDTTAFVAVGIFLFCVCSYGLRSKHSKSSSRKKPHAGYAIKK